MGKKISKNRFTFALAKTCTGSEFSTGGGVDVAPEDWWTWAPEAWSSFILASIPSPQITRQSLVCSIELSNTGPTVPLGVKPSPAGWWHATCNSPVSARVDPRGVCVVAQANGKWVLFVHGVVVHKVLPGTNFPGRQGLSPSLYRLSKARKVWFGDSVQGDCSLSEQYHSQRQIPWIVSWIF